MTHDSYAAEELALAWHWFGLFLSIGTVICGIGGVLWHAWAVAQHKHALRGLNVKNQWFEGEEMESF